MIRNRAIDPDPKLQPTQAFFRRPCRGVRSCHRVGVAVGVPPFTLILIAQASKSAPCRFVAGTCSVSYKFAPRNRPLLPERLCQFKSLPRDVLTQLFSALRGRHGGERGSYLGRETREHLIAIATLLKRDLHKSSVFTLTLSSPGVGILLPAVLRRAELRVQPLARLGTLFAALRPLLWITLVLALGLWLAAIGTRRPLLARISGPVMRAIALVPRPVSRRAIVLKPARIVDATIAASAVKGSEAGL